MGNRKKDRLFLSYARSDGEEFTQPLYDSLQTNGYGGVVG
jgi:hypothetical protein